MDPWLQSIMALPHQCLWIAGVWGGGEGGGGGGGGGRLPVCVWRFENAKSLGLDVISRSEYFSVCMNLFP